MYLLQGSLAVSTVKVAPPAGTPSWGQTYCPSPANWFLLCLPQPGSPPPPQQFVVQHSLFGSPVPKTKDPPRYEEAIKQTRSAQSSLPEVRRPRSNVVGPPEFEVHPGLDGLASQETQVS